MDNMGDYELLSILLQKYPGHICVKPIAIQVETITGQPATSTGDVLKVFDASNGFACFSADQNGKFCQDYKVRFTCPPDFCMASAECRTVWFNSDSPRVNKEGDIETIAHIRKNYPGRMCASPTGIEASTWSGLSALLTPDVIKDYDVSNGFVCLNGDQNLKECKDYSVKFTCPASFCEGCRTQWFNRDNPTNSGDYETLVELRNEFPDKICTDPIGIEAQTVDGIPASQTGQTLEVYDATFGFACMNKKQSNGTVCQDYMVRFTCPQQFCSGKRA